MNSSYVLDPERISSFKTSLLNLKDAMQQRQNLRKAGVATEPFPASYSRSAGRTEPRTPFRGWLQSEREGILWILVCASLGALLGFGVGAGWLTRGAGSYQYLTKSKRFLASAMSAKADYVPKKAAKHFVVSAWRADLAKRTRKTLLYQLLTLKKSRWRFAFDFLWGLLFWDTPRPKQHWIAASPLWPPNWILFREVDLSQIDVTPGHGLSPMFVSTLSFILPWRRGLIRALARKDQVKPINIRDQDGNVVEPSLTSSLSSALLSSTPSSHPVNPYYHPIAFHTLREYIIRFENGYVHPDLGFLVPAPSGELSLLQMEASTCYKPAASNSSTKIKISTLFFPHQAQRGG